MTNPWLKKNPFMSLWLSGANKVANSIRGHAAAQTQRQAAVITHATQDVLNLWAGALAPSPPVKRKKKRG